MLLPLTFYIAKMLDRLVSTQYKPEWNSVSNLDLR